MILLRPALAHLVPSPAIGGARQDEDKSSAPAPTVPSGPAPTVPSGPAADIYNKAVRLYEKHHWNAAKEYFHQYLAEYSDTPLYVTCLYYLAYCYQQLGNKEQALGLYQKVLDLGHGPDTFWVDMAEHRMEEIK